MNDKSMMQIEEMKKQTIGVEVEMNNITRRDAAKLAAEFLARDDTGTLPTATATAHGAHGMPTTASGNLPRT